jgi:hypothetical protein
MSTAAQSITPALDPYTVYKNEDEAQESGESSCCTRIWLPFIYTPCQAVLGLATTVTGIAHWHNSW